MCGVHIHRVSHTRKEEHGIKMIIAKTNKNNNLGGGDFF